MTPQIEGPYRPRRKRRDVVHVAALATVLCLLLWLIGVVR